MMLREDLVEDENLLGKWGEKSCVLVCTYTSQSGPTTPGSWQGLPLHLDVEPFSWRETSRRMHGVDRSIRKG